MPRRKQQAPKRLKAHEGDIDDVSPGELADDESDDVDESKERDDDDSSRTVKETDVATATVKKEKVTDDDDDDDDVGNVPAESLSLSSNGIHSKDQDRLQHSPVHQAAASTTTLPYQSPSNGPMTMLSNMCTALSGTDSDSDNVDLELEAVLRLNRLGMFTDRLAAVPEQEEALDLRVSKVKHRKDHHHHHHHSHRHRHHHDKFNSSKSKLRSSDSSSPQSPGKSVKTVFCETVPRDVLASVSRLQADYSVLPTQVSLCRGVNGRCNFVLCTDCYQAFPNVGMLSLHLIATGHNSTKQVNSELMLQRGYLALVPPRTEFFSTCALRRKQRLPAASSRKELCAYTCSTCSVSFPDFLDYTVHLTTSGHDKQEKQQQTSPSKTPAGDCPEEIPVNQVLKCMICQLSFRTLKDLTMHMVRTKHYSHVPGHTGILLTRGNSKSDERGADDIDEDADVLDEEEDPVAESLPATTLPKTSEMLSKREQRSSQSSVSSKEDSCQNTKAALNQLLTSRIQNSHRSPDCAKQADSSSSHRPTKCRSLKCLGCYHLFANVHKLTEHMKERGHFFSPMPALEDKEAPPASTNGLLTTKSQTSIGRKHLRSESRDSAQQPGDKIKIVLKDGASKKQLLSVSNNADSTESKKTSLINIRNDLIEDTECQPLKKLQMIASAQTITSDKIKKETQQEPPATANETPRPNSRQSPRPQVSPLPSSPIKYVNPENFDEIFPASISRLGWSTATSDSGPCNPLDKLTSMVETAKENNYHPRLQSQNSHLYHNRPPWVPLVETPQQQYLNSNGLFPSYAGLAMVYNAVSLATTSPSEAIASKMEKHLKAKESENVTVAEAIDKILSHSFRKDDKSSDPRSNLATARDSANKPCNYSKTHTRESFKRKMALRKSSKHSRYEHLKRSSDNKDVTGTDNEVHRRVPKKRHCLPTEAARSTFAKGQVGQPKFSTKRSLPLKPYHPETQRVDQTRSSSKGEQLQAAAKRQMVRATTITAPVHRKPQKKSNLVGVFMKKSAKLSSSRKLDRSRREVVKDSRHGRNSSYARPNERTYQDRPQNDSTATRHENAGVITRNHTVNTLTTCNQALKASSLGREEGKTKPKSAKSVIVGSVDSGDGDGTPAQITKSGARLENSDSVAVRQSNGLPLAVPCSSRDAPQDKQSSEMSSSYKRSIRNQQCERKPAELDNGKIHNDDKHYQDVSSVNNRHLSDKTEKALSTVQSRPSETKYVSQNGYTYPAMDGDDIGQEGHIGRLKRSLEMYKMFTAGVTSRPVNRRHSQSENCGSNVGNTETLKETPPPNPTPKPSNLTVVKIKQEPGVDSTQCPEKDQRPPSRHGVPVKRTLNNNTLSHCSTSAKNVDANHSVIRSLKAHPDPRLASSTVTDNSANTPGNEPSNLTKYAESPAYPTGDPLLEIGKLVNSTTGVQHLPVPPKIARISVDMINRGAFVLKREPEIYVNPGSDNIKTNPLEEMCKMLNATRR